MTTLRPQLASPLQLITLASAVLILLPLGYITSQALSADPAVWSRLWATRIPELLTNTIRLSASVACLTLILGVSTAWLVARIELPGRRLWEAALVLPLAMPTYVLAYIYSYLLGFGGPVEQVWQTVAGPQARIFSPYSYVGATLVMTLDTFPFVYLLSRSALLNMNVSFEEVSRASGISRMKTLWLVTLPLMRPSIAAGLALVILYVVSDFGAVSLLRYQTLTYAVFQQLTGRSDNTAASILSLLLVGLALLFLVTERWFRHRSRFYQTTGRYRRPERYRYGWLGTSVIRLSCPCARSVVRTPGVSSHYLEPLSGGPEHHRQPLLRFLVEQRLSSRLCSNRRCVDRCSVGVHGQPAPQLAEPWLLASRLRRVCTPWTSRCVGGFGALLEPDPIFIWIRVGAYCRLCDPFPAGRIAVARAGIAANYTQSRRSRPYLGSWRGTNLAAGDAASHAQWIRRGVGTDVPPDDERASSHLAVAARRIRYPGH